MSAKFRSAFVLGAGLGTRLRSLTEHRPKPLIPIFQRPLITFAFDHLLALGVEKLVVNTHHCPEEYPRFFPGASYRGSALHFVHEPLLLETGGGIKNIESLLRDEPFIVYNGDVLTDLPIAPAIEEHFARGNEVTLVLRSAGGPLQVALHEDSGRIAGIGSHDTHGFARRFLFSGIYIVEPEFCARIPVATKISVIPIFQEMIRRGEKLGGIVIDEGHWWDLGTREQYLEAHRHFATHPFPGAAQIHPTAKISSGAQITGATAIGENAKVGARAVLHDCVVWENAEIADDSDLKRCIVTAGKKVRGQFTDQDF